MLVKGALRNFKMIQINFKKFIQKFFNKNSWPYWISFIIPMAVFYLYFACNNFNILTVDLGQQYVDLLAFLRKNLFTDSLNLIYSFSNGLGNSMIGVDAYYLFSPFNLILFLFPIKYLPFAILLLISLKIGSIGLSSFYYWKRHGSVKNTYALTASIAYALSGYVIANHINLMWLDSLILLPLLIDAIDQTLAKKKNHLILVTFALWITNFYTGYMALLFGFLYFLSKIFFFPSKDRFPLIKRYLLNSILASFLAAFILLPVFFELLAGKVSGGATWDFSLQYQPFDELSKLIDGSYNFHEMEKGLPNIFISLPLTLLTIAYFFSKKINWKNKMANGILLLFLLLSTIFSPLVLLWHMGQFPIWYPARFSFVLIFFALNLVINFLSTEEDLSWISNIILSLIGLGLILYWIFFQNDFTFINDTNIIISAAFIFGGLLFLLFIFTKNKFAGVFLYTIVCVEMVANLIFSLNNLSYQENRDYQNYLINSSETTNYLNKKDKNFYRVEKTFYRSDDDPFTSNYNGITSFNSITDAKSLKLLSSLGYIHNSNSVTNNGGTLLTDSLLGIKYYLKPNYIRDNINEKAKMQFNNNNQRPDTNKYPIVKDFSQLILNKNNTSLPLAFLSNISSSSLNWMADDPIYNQELLFKKITGSTSSLFKEITLNSPKTSGVSFLPNNRQLYNWKKNANNPNITFNYQANRNDSYYLQLPASLNENSVSLYINNQEYDLSMRDDQTRLINISNYQTSSHLKIKFVLKATNLDLSDLKLWQLNLNEMDKVLTRFNQNQPITHQVNPLLLRTNSFSTKETKILNTTIPYSKNWLIFDNGNLLHKGLFANTFLSAKLQKGSHQLIFIYIPFALLLGILISLMSLVFLKLFWH